MNTDCPQCAEWELCPFHPKEERAPEPAHDDEWCDAVSYSMVGISDMHRTGQGVVRLSSDCGEYVRVYLNGKLVDEEPAEAYKDHTIEAMVQSYKSIRCEPAEAYHFQNSMGCVVSFSSHDKAMSWLSSQPFPLEWRCSVSVKR